MFPGNVVLDSIDEQLFRISDISDPSKVWGLLEVPTTRFPIIYTTLEANTSDAWIHRMIESSPWLDRMWLSAPILYQLWQYVQATTPSHRFVRLGFEHEAIYETSSESNVNEDVDFADEHDQEDSFSIAAHERRHSRVQLTEQLGVLQSKLPKLLDIYNPLQSLIQLQMPSSSKGGHLFNYNGKVTNRSDSFLEHRSTVGLVSRLYENVTNGAEDRLWMDAEADGFGGLSLVGSPVTVTFGESLSESTFERLVTLGLQRRTSRFRIGGFLERRGPTKIHMAAIDRHLWQPFLLEATTSQLVAVLPRGTCGNTINRLVTNVQRLVDPTAQIWLGSEKYSEVVATSFGVAA